MPESGPESEPASGQREVDLAIAGNGAIACALALRFHVEHPGARVALVGPRRRFASASAAAAAMLNVFAELEPGCLDYPVARAKFELARAASAAWPAHVELLRAKAPALGSSLAIIPGTHVVLRAREPGSAAAARFEAMLGYLRDAGEPFREVDPREIRGLHLEAGAPPARAIAIDHEGRIDARGLLRAYDDAFARAEIVDVVDDEVTTVDGDGAMKTLRLASGTTLRAKQVVLAAGARTQELVERIGLADRVPRIVAGVGAAVLVAGVERAPDEVLRCFSDDAPYGGVYVVPQPDGTTYIGATTHVHERGTAEPHEGAVRELLDGAARAVSPALGSAAVREVLFGWRPITLDNHPLLGRTSIDGVWIASGTRRDGLHLSPTIAEELVRCLASGEQPFGGVFRPERALILERGIPPELLHIHRASARVGVASGS